MTEADLQKMHDRMTGELARAGAKIDATFYCPHDTEPRCDCRKPAPGMLLSAARLHGIDLQASFQLILNSDATIGEYVYSLIDPSGTTHEIESDWSTPNTYRATDGSGYTFLPADSTGHNAYDFGANNADNYGEGIVPSPSSKHYWLANAGADEAGWSIGIGGARLGTVLSPTGIKYTDYIVQYSTPTYNQSGHSGSQNESNYEYFTPRSLVSTATDPSGNVITRCPWYWSGYQSNATSSPPFSDIISTFYTQTPTFDSLLPAPSYGCSPLSIISDEPYYKDSVGRIIPNVVAMQATITSRVREHQFAVESSSSEREHNRLHNQL